MYTFYLVAGIILAFILFLIIKHYKELEFYAYIAIFFLGFILFMIATPVVGYMVKAEYVEVRETEYIESMQDNSSTKGTFFLGSGSINGEMKYTYYTNDNNVYQLKQVSCNKAVITYTDTLPRAVKVYYKKTDCLQNKFSFRCNDDYCYIFFVPKGTIKQNFNLDAQ